MKIYTRTGDSGETGLFGGGRTSKASWRVEAYGAVDELNAFLGLAVSVLERRRSGGDAGNGDESAGAADGSTAAGDGSAAPAEGSAVGATLDRLRALQHDLFSIGSALSAPPAREGRRRPEVPRVPEERIAEMEAWIDEAEAELEPLRAFILPGGGAGAAHLHVCRTVCRRAERAVVRLAEESEVEPAILRYLNRLSDLLFVLARLEDHDDGRPDVPWRKEEVGP